MVRAALDLPGEEWYRDITVELVPLRGEIRKTSETAVTFAVTSDAGPPADGTTVGWITLSRQGRGVGRGQGRRGPRAVVGVARGVFPGGGPARPIRLRRSDGGPPPAGASPGYGSRGTRPLGPQCPPRLGSTGPRLVHDRSGHNDRLPGPGSRLPAGLPVEDDRPGARGNPWWHREAGLGHGPLPGRRADRRLPPRRARRHPSHAGRGRPDHARTSTAGPRRRLARESTSTSWSPLHQPGVLSVTPADPPRRHFRSRTPRSWL